METKECVWQLKKKKKKEISLAWMSLLGSDFKLRFALAFTNYIRKNIFVSSNVLLEMEMIYMFLFVRREESINLNA